MPTPAEPLKAAIEQAQPGSEVFVDQTGLRYGHLWQPALFDAIAKSTAFIILVSNQLGDWQKVEYYEARDRKAKDDDYLLLPIVVADKTKGPAANLPGLAQLHWIETTEPAAPEPLSRIVAALSSKAVPKPPEPWRIINPYRGLLALEEQDADFFSGRDLETAGVLEAVINKPGRLIALIGNSGVGKSSLVQAGIIGSLKRQRWPGGGQTWPAALKDSRSWAFLSMRSGEDPVEALGSTFASLWFVDATNPDRVANRKKWAAMLKDGTAGLSDLIETTDARFRTELGLEPPRRFFLYIDQGEELYSAPKDRIKSFSELVARGLKHSRLVVMTSQRSDYYGQLQANEALFPLTERIDVPPLGAEALKTVLREPARVLGVKLESDDLVEQIVGSAEDQPGALPLLADLFTDLWERMQARGDGTLRVTDHREIIQVGAALSRRADLFVGQHPAQVEDVKRLFTLRLAHVPRMGEPVRRRMVRRPEREEEWKLAQTLAGPEWRLLVTGENNQGEATAEVAHEVLFKTWAKLKEWLEREHDFLVWRDDLGARLREYQKLEKASRSEKREALLVGLPLSQAEQWLKARAADIDPPEQRFITDSRQRERVRKRNLGVAATVGIAAVAAFAGFAFTNWIKAREATKRATENLIRAESATAEAQKNLVLAREAREETQSQLDRANQALAAEILADLDLKRGEPFTARQRNALWRLAAADEKVHAHFISALSASGEEIARVGAGFNEVSRSLGLQWPPPSDAEKLLAKAVAAVNSANSDTMGGVLQALATKLTESQAQQAFATVLERIGRTTSPKALAGALQAVAAKLTDAQAPQALVTLLERIDKTTDPDALRALAGALQAVAARLTDARAPQALATLLEQIGKTADPGALQALAGALQVVPAKLTDAQAPQALATLLEQIGKTTDPDALRALAGVLQVVPAKLTDAQAQQALARVLEDPMGKTTNPDALRALAGALQAVAAKLTDAQAQQALATLLEPMMGKTTNPYALPALAGALQTVAAKLTDAQAQQAFATLLEQIGKITNPDALQALAGALQAVAAKLTDAQAQQALARVLEQIGKTTDPDALQALAGALQAVPAKLTDAQAQQALVRVLEQIGKTTDPDELLALAGALQAVPAKLTDAQVPQALVRVLERIGKTDDPDALQALAGALQAVAAKLTEAQAQRALATVLEQIGKTTDPDRLRALAGALQAVATKLTDAQAQEAFATVVERIGRTTNPDALRALAGALQALAAKLSEPSARQALIFAASSLAWATTEDEAMDWARAVVALLPSTANKADQNETRRLVSAILYPPAAGPATEVLLDALRVRHADAPAKEAGTAASLAWVAEKYPNEVRRPICPPPPQPNSGLNCPREGPR